MRYKEVEENVGKQAFIEQFDKHLVEFRQHAKRVTVQYNEMRRLRESLSENEMVVWMDFAEKYRCVSLEEIQSAYWNATAISLHTSLRSKHKDGLVRNQDNVRYVYLRIVVSVS
jgi:membrane-bound inhibitor of C-type lysozyme